MKIFNYDKDTGEFLSEGYAQVNPKKDGGYLFPAYSTTLVPPVLSVNEAAIYNGEYWNIVSDYRGLDVINLSTKEISKVDYLGNIKSGFLLYSDYVKTNDYKNDLHISELEEKKNEILSELEDLDLKRVRAICEPSVKNSSTGETWLDFYNSKIITLRQKYSEVCNGN